MQPIIGRMKRPQLRGITNGVGRSFLGCLLFPLSDHGRVALLYFLLLLTLRLWFSLMLATLLLSVTAAASLSVVLAQTAQGEPDVVP